MNLRRVGCRTRLACSCLWYAGVLLSCVLWLLTIAVAQESTPSVQGSIDWQGGVVRSQAQSDGSEGVTTTRQVSAYTAAVQTARQRLLATLGQLRVSAAHTVGDLVHQMPEKQQALAGMVAEAEVITTRYLPRDMVESTVQLPLGGRFTALLLPATPPLATLPELSAEAVYTGVVIDARGLAIQPALFPQIVDEQGQILYAPMQVDATMAVQRGYVAYAYTIDSPQLETRVGKQPLVLRARRALGPTRVDLVLGPGEAAQLQQADALRRLLMQCRVAIIG